MVCLNYKNSSQATKDIHAKYLSMWQVCEQMVLQKDNLQKH